jgi:carotenoid 1,2-hydratase
MSIMLSSWLRNNSSLRGAGFFGGIGKPHRVDHHNESQPGLLRKPLRARARKIASFWRDPARNLANTITSNPPKPTHLCGFERFSRATSSVVCYEGIRRDGRGFASALRFGADGVPHEEEALPPVAPLPNTLWQMERKTRADRGHASVIRTWEDAPFYARSTLSSRLFGEPVVAVQESLDLDRFSSPIVQFMLPYRIPQG